MLFKPILALLIIDFSRCRNYWGGGGGKANDMFPPPKYFHWGATAPLPPRIDVSVLQDYTVTVMYSSCLFIVWSFQPRGYWNHLTVCGFIILSKRTLLEKKCNLEPFCPVFRTLGEKGSQKGSLHVQEPKKVLYITKNGSKGPKKVLKMVLKTNLKPFREPLKVPPVGQPKNPFF